MNDFERKNDKLGNGIFSFSYVRLLPRTLNSHSTWVIRFCRNACNFFNQVPTVSYDHDVIISWCIVLFGLWTKVQKEKYGHHIMDIDRFGFRSIFIFMVG
ncbi:hypothetical protein [Paenibacillus sp. DMB5]|uniref:hypothetical protein n=1 Tax=Paenibacillus sp. DMB5 TaxID=1780103 RepID=UPI0009EC5EA0|nr:hypothetical protein [Paenibacillus sp. DMB5]